MLRQQVSTFLLILIVVTIAGCANIGRSSYATFTLSSDDVYSARVENTSNGPVARVQLSPAKQSELQVLSALALGKYLNIEVDANIISTSKVVRVIDSASIDISCSSVNQAQKIVASLLGR